MKKLYYSVIIFFVVFVGGLMLPKAKAAGEFDDTAHYIGFIEGYEYNDNGDEIGAWVYIEESSLPVGDFSRYYLFGFEYFQPDLTILFNEMIGRRLIWNSFDDRSSYPDYFGNDYNGSWWLLIGYEYISDNIGEAYEYGYESGFNNGYNAGELAGYNNGYNIGYDDGLGDGFNVGYEDGELQGWNDGYSEGYDDGHDDGREQVLNSIESMEILYQDVVLPNGIKDEIINNEILVDRVGVAVFDGSESWGTGNFNDIPPFSTIGFERRISSEFDEQRRHFICNNLELERGIIWGVDIPRIDVMYEFVQIRVLKSDLVPYGYDDSMADYQKINVFKSWLAAQKESGEPLTVWYQYAESKEYDLVSLLTNADGSFLDGYNKGYTQGRVHVQKENKSLLSVIPTTIGSVWLMISDFLSFEVFGLNVWSIIIIFASFSLLVLLIKMVI